MEELSRYEPMKWWEAVLAYISMIFLVIAILGISLEVAKIEKERIRVENIVDPNSL